eukprot:scaffold23570_cov112-Isochrysis_galbana.AAC.4
MPTEANEHAQQQQHDQQPQTGPHRRRLLGEPLLLFERVERVLHLGRVIPHRARRCPRRGRRRRRRRERRRRVFAQNSAGHGVRRRPAVQGLAGAALEAARQAGAVAGAVAGVARVAAARRLAAPLVLARALLPCAGTLPFARVDARAPRLGIRVGSARGHLWAVDVRLALAQESGRAAALGGQAVGVVPRAVLPLVGADPVGSVEAVGLNRAARGVRADRALVARKAGRSAAALAAAVAKVGKRA